MEEIEQKQHLLILPYQGDIHNLLPNHINTQVIYTGKKLSTCFNIKYQTKIEHQHDIVYHGKCPLSKQKKIHLSYLGPENNKTIFLFPTALEDMENLIS